jgi:hypothetical protein
MEGRIVPAVEVAKVLVIGFQVSERCMILSWLTTVRLNTY